MKNKNLYFLSVLAALAVGLAACNSGLEPEPLELTSPDYVWDTQDSAGVNAGQVLANIYAELPEGFNRVGGDFLDASTDDAASSLLTPTGVQEIAQGIGLTAYRNNEGGAWANSFRGIRKANIFIANIDKVPLAGTLTSGVSLRSSWKAEARFLRAFFYFELVKRWGGVPLMGDEVRQITDNSQLPRNTYAECVEYIVSECDAVKDSLRHDPIDNINFGRVTRGTAMALKARVLLYAASPLFNEGNIGTGNLRKFTGYEDAGASAVEARWRRAAVAAQDIINLGVFTLQGNFKDVFLVANSREVIFARNNRPNRTIERTNGPIGFSGDAVGDSRTSPSQNLVDAFPMINGKSITDPTSGYNPNIPYDYYRQDSLGNYELQRVRDPRLSLTVLHHGSRWLNTFIQTDEGGAQKPGGTRVQTRSSYYLRKFMGNFETQTTYADHPANFVMFRLAEVALNFAEATNEISGATPAVYEVLYQLRARAGIRLETQEGATTRYGLAPNMTKEQMREVIRNERRIELAFEEHRFWDIRRWKIAQQLAQTPVNGMRIRISAVTGTIQGTLVPLVQPNFAPYAYLFPIAQGDLDRNSQLVQNPGWQ